MSHASLLLVLPRQQGQWSVSAWSFSGQESQLGCFPGGIHMQKPAALPCWGASCNPELLLAAIKSSSNRSCSRAVTWMVMLQWIWINFIIYVCFYQSPRLVWFLFPFVALGKRSQMLAECLQEEIAEQQSSVAQPGCCQRWLLPLKCEEQPFWHCQWDPLFLGEPQLPSSPSLLLGKALKALPPLLSILIVDVEKALGRRGYTDSLLRESRPL